MLVLLQNNLWQISTKLERVSDGGDIEKSILDEAAVNLLQVADTNYGGFGQAPKFPNAANLSFMFRYSKLSGITKFQDFALLTLKKWQKVVYLIKLVVDFIDIPPTQDGLYHILKKCCMTMHYCLLYMQKLIR